LWHKGCWDELSARTEHDKTIHEIMVDDTELPSNSSITVIEELSVADLRRNIYQSGRQAGLASNRS
jgi:hypothetical protein